jgi:taurine dioxygenase
MSLTDHEITTTNAAVAKLEGVSGSGELGEFNAKRVAMGPDRALIGPVAHLSAERIRLAALEWNNFTVRQVAPTLGAVVEGLDLSQPLGDEVFAELRDAWVQYKVLFFRNQDLTGEQHVAFAQQFGELEQHPFLPGNDEIPELVRFSKDAETGGYENAWHHDVTWRESPAMGAVLRAIEVPDTGGDTLFCDMTAAYDGLSEDLKDRLEGMVAVHDFLQAFGPTLTANEQAEMREKYPMVEHPVVVRHPVSGRRILYVNRFFTSHIVGLSKTESDDLLAELYQQAHVIEYHCRFHWEPNSIA